MAGTSRIYFSRNGVELTDHPANGMSYSSVSCYVATIGRTKCRRCIFVDSGHGSTSNSYLLTEADFDGPVMVRTWHPAREFNETFALCDPATAVANGGHLSGHTDEHIGPDGRGVAFQGHLPFEEYLAWREA